MTARRALLAALISILSISDPATAQSGSPRLEPLPVETVLSARTIGQFGAPRLSPEGQWAAYTICEPRRVPLEPDPRFKRYSRTGIWTLGSGCEIWITETRTGESRRLTDEKSSSWAPSWSPDGRSLAFYSDRSGTAGIWVWERASGRSRQVSDLIARPIAMAPPAWTREGASLVVRVLPAGMTVEQAADRESAAPQQTAPGGSAGATVTVYRSAARKGSEASSGAVGAWSTDADRADLALVDVSSGAARRLVTGDKPIGYWISPDGSRVAFLASRGFGKGGAQQVFYDLGIVPIVPRSPDAVRVRIVAKDIPEVTGTGASWSPDGRFIAYLTAEGNCYLVPADGGEPRKAARQAHPPFRDDEFTAPIWNSKGSSLYFIADNALWKISAADGSASTLTSLPGRDLLEVLRPAPGTDSVLLVARDRDSFDESVIEVSLSSGARREIWKDARSLGRDPAVRIDGAGDVIVIGIQAADRDEDFWALSRTRPEVRRLTHVNPAFDRYVLGTSRLVEWLSLDGPKVRGALLLPAGYQEGKRYPLVVFVYGGGHLANGVHTFGMHGGWGVDDNFQLLATRGYAVFLPDAPSDWKDQMRDLPKSVLPGINRVIDLGIADPDRLGLMGHSNGGYSTLALITLTNRFKAAVMRAGMGDFMGFYGELGRDGSHYGLGVAEGAFGMGTPWQHRSRYIENSPVFYLDRVETPLLIVHGGVDPYVAPFLADEVFVDLRRLGKEVEYARYEGESHWIEGYENLRDYCNRMIGWFDEHLKKNHEQK